MLQTAGNIGFILAGSGILAFAILFLVSVRWWTDTLGWIIAGVFSAASLIMSLSIVRLLGLPLPGLFWWRAFLFNALGLVVWSGFWGFVWAQFLAPRIRSFKSRSHRKEDHEQ